MEFGNKHLIYFSRKDKALYILYELGEGGHLFGDAEEWEATIPIVEDDAMLLEKVFALLVEAYHVFHARGGTLWFVCDGSFCTVISGRRRVHYDGPCGQEPFDSFDSLAYELISLKENNTLEEMRRIVKLAKDVKKQLEGFIGQKQ